MNLRRMRHLFKMFLLFSRISLCRPLKKGKSEDGTWLKCETRVKFFRLVYSSSAFRRTKENWGRNCFPVISISWKIILTVGQVQEQFLWRADVLQQWRQNNSVLEFRNFSSSQEKTHTVVAHKSTLPMRGSFLYCTLRNSSSSQQKVCS